MEKINLHYSNKNIPIASERHYKSNLLEKIEAVIKRMRWKAAFFDEENENENEYQQEETYGLKTKNTPRQIPEMTDFEKELIELARNVKFQKGKDNFQLKIKNDIDEINQCDKILVHADKTSNMYKLTKTEYDKHLHNAITKTYKKAKPNLQKEINKEGKELMKDDKIINRMSINAENSSFITMKDHKENFENNPTTRLINPAKNELGRMSKYILEKINKTIREKLSLNQWKSTSNVIDWFKNIKNKHLCKFMVFDIKDFYPSISEKLLTNALNFANSISKIDNKEKEIIFHSRKSLLFNEGETWIKKGAKLFDVTMGAYDGAEVCELVGCFLLYQLKTKYSNEDIGLYRDDGLAVFKNTNAQKSEKIKKELQKIFKDNGLEIVIQCNMQIVDFLDVTFNLQTSLYKPFHKPDNETNYVHVKSNHPPSIIKQIPLSIEKRISNLSSSEAIFDSAAPYYQEALKRSGYNHSLKYKPSTQLNSTKNINRKRKIIWFNPPFNKNVSTPIAKNFLKLVNKHFPKNNKFYKIFNKNTIKVSYSCMPNIKSKINQHNHQIIKPNIPENNKTCNCITKINCPLENKCLTENIIYEATITTPSNQQYTKHYIGLCETTFKKRYANHKKTFNHLKYEHDTTLSTEYWKLKKRNLNPQVSWKIIRRTHSFKPESKKCSLCLAEKFEIVYHPYPHKLLNRRSEVIAKCRHQRKFDLALYNG